MSASNSRRSALIKTGQVLGALQLTGVLPWQTSSVQAQGGGYPVKTVKLVVPNPPGGPTDALGRKLAQLLTLRLGQQFIVDNKAGASGAIGLKAVSVSPNDGYTIGYGSFSLLVLNPLLRKDFPFNPTRDLMPVSALVDQAMVLAVNPGLGVNTLPELIQKLKANPGKYNFSSPGINQMQHLLGEQFKLSAGIDMTHVPYAGDALSFQAVVAGDTQMAFTNFALYKGLLDRVKLIALASPDRSLLLPLVPTFEEQGVRGMGNKVWHALFAPAGTPTAIIELLDREVRIAMATSDFAAAVEQMGLEPSSQTLSVFSRRFNDDIELWRSRVKSLSIQMS